MTATIEQAAGVKSPPPVSTDYAPFLDRKRQLDGDHGFAPMVMPSYLFDFQAALVDWAVRKGRAAIFADCGLGKTLMEMVWAENVARHTDKPVLILTPLAVAQQFVAEGEKFGIDIARSSHGEMPDSRLIVANYERLHLLAWDRFGGVVCDESSILKNFGGARRAEITEFMRQHQFRLLGTATAAPNDYWELGTSSEALGYLGHMDMLGRFFTNRRHNPHGYNGKFRLINDDLILKPHAVKDFWRWVSSWARAMRKPSDLGFSDDGFDLPPLTIDETLVQARTVKPGMLFDIPAQGFHEEREMTRRTIAERCEEVSGLVNETGQPAVVWCHLNDEGDLLEKLIPDGIQVSGRDDDDAKETKFGAFSSGDIRVLITKPKIGAWGLNWQHCNHVTFFPSHSYEQYYQAVRRCWRFGQERPVTVNIVGTDGDGDVLKNLQRKADGASRMFTELVSHMNDALRIDRSRLYANPVEVPSWLKVS
jgi:hypothetical protein